MGKHGLLERCDIKNCKGNNFLNEVYKESGRGSIWGWYDGAFKVKIALMTITRPAQYVTTRSYPNPFNPSTVIRYELSQSGRVLITVLNTVGQKVREYDLGMRDRGAHELVFNAKGLTSGTYMYRVDAGYATVQGKMMFMK